MGLFLLLGVFAFCVMIGAPVAFALGISAVAAFWFEGLPMMIGFQRIVAGISLQAYLAIPFFIFAGDLMFHGGIAARLVRFAQAAVGAVRGGLGIVNVFSSMLFGGISGSAIADISALGSILIPAMKEKGYDADYAVNVTVTSSIAGIIIPPSHNMIIFALAAGGGVSISKLFLAGVVPGILMCVCLALAAYLVAIKRGYQAEKFPGLAALGYAFAGAIPGLFTAFIIVGGVLSGIFTATESGAIGAIYAFLITLVVYRTLTWENFKTTVVSSVRTTSMVLVLIACAGAFAYMLTFYRVPSKTVDLLLGISDNVFLILLKINLMPLVLGMIMDMAALILICTPIFLPVMNALGVDPVQFGIILLVNLGLGLCTPPVGTCLFAGCVVGKLPMEKAVKTIWPFYLAILAALMLITFVPAISLTLPNLLIGNWDAGVDMLTIKRLDIDDAHALIAGARAKAQDIGVPMCIAIVDESGNLVAFERMDGGKFTSINLAIDKAFTANGIQKSTQALGEVNQPGMPAHGIASALGGRMVAVAGGLPVHASADVVGAIGVSSGSPAQDHDVAQAGLDAFSNITQNNS